eukprot:1753702-Rhodomonas_salina.2
MRFSGRWSPAYIMVSLMSVRCRLSTPMPYALNTPPISSSSARRAASTPYTRRICAMSLHRTCSSSSNACQACARREAEAFDARREHQEARHRAHLVEVEDASDSLVVVHAPQRKQIQVHALRQDRTLLVAACSQPNATSAPHPTQNIVKCIKRLGRKGASRIARAGVLVLLWEVDGREATCFLRGL